MKKIVLLISLILLWVTQAWAVPTLQVGAPAALGDDGDYADYLSILTNPTEDDTAVTSGNLIYVAGLYENDVVKLGGQYDDGVFSGDDWTTLLLADADDSRSFFADRGAILIATVPEAQFNTGTLKVNDESYFFKSTENSFLPSTTIHAPLNYESSAYFFFDLGDFLQNEEIPNFADEDETPSDKKLGEIKDLILTVSGFDWVHFDVMALETIGVFKKDENKTEILTSIKSTDLESNPGSHDVTWKFDEGTVTPGGDPVPVPEPATILLVGAGLVGLAVYQGRQRR